jgi:hypothetical protein
MVNFTLLPFYTWERCGTKCARNWVGQRAIWTGTKKMPPTGVGIPDLPNLNLVDI